MDSAIDIVVLKEKAFLRCELDTFERPVSENGISRNLSIASSVRVRLPRFTDA